jgi:hypothetical protein
MDRPLKILILTKKFAEKMPKHQHKYDMLTAIEKEADVRYWHADGDILDILPRIDFEPDFIFHYDIEWHNAFAPKIANLNKVGILKGCYVLDVHYAKSVRLDYFRKAKPDIIFSATKYPFLKAFPDCASRFSWLPFGINADVFKDYGLDKDIAYSLVGLINEQYPFRMEVLKQMSGKEGFKHFRHPGHTTKAPGMFINDKYAKAINRSMMSFTCGSRLAVPVAKFFEIPACRTLMLAEPNADIEELGFRAGVHYEACGRSDFYDKALKLRADEQRRTQMTNDGYAFIHNHHRNETRAVQFVAAVRQLLSSRRAEA